jgi:hypothetical protein
MIEASILVLAFGCGQNRYVGMHDSQVACVHYRIVHRSKDNGTVEEFLVDTVGIAFLLKRLFQVNIHVIL